MHPLESYAKSLATVKATQATTDELSFYPVLAALFDYVGNSLDPKVTFVASPKGADDSRPDGGFFTHDQLVGWEGESIELLLKERKPSHGVVEVKGLTEDVQKVAQSTQVKKYLVKYGQVLVTNYREFVLVSRGDGAGIHVQEAFSLADSAPQFWECAKHPKKLVATHGDALLGYLKRVILSAAPISAPRDIASHLAVYARMAKVRVEAKELPALQYVRQALEESLGLTFQGDEGAQFFRSTLVQTLWYGIFASWVLWSKQHPHGDKHATFAWRTAVWSLRVPVIGYLFEQVATPTKLGPLNLVEVLDWTENALNRVDRHRFFEVFDEGLAVQYFYEPFLAAYDPELRKELGVWYTPPEVVEYQVARIDSVLREEMGIKDGFADPQVVVLDPCCGTGAYLVAVARRIAKTLQEKAGADGLFSDDVKDAVLNRLFGFEVMPAPYVVSHLQIGLFLQAIGVPLDVDESERASVFLTNSLSGWGGSPGKHQYSIPAFDEEREAAEQIKQKEKVLVVLGNPPYNAYAGVSATDDDGNVNAYKTGLAEHWGIKKFNLDDLYVRFVRVAERRIAEMTKRGIICFISNSSFVKDKSFVVLRERLLTRFDTIWIDNLNGDSRETGKLTPDGQPDPSIFSTDLNREGIRKGTAISLFLRRHDKAPWPVNHQSSVRYRDFWGVGKREQLLASLEPTHQGAEYKEAKPTPDNYLSLKPLSVSASYLSWPVVTELSAIAPINGLMEKRRGALYDIDRDALSERMSRYFDQEVPWGALVSEGHPLSNDAARFDAKKARSRAIAAEHFDPQRIMRFAVRPFDHRWAYYTTIRPLWNEPRPALRQQIFPGNEFVVTRPGAAASPEGVPFYFSRIAGDNDALRGHAYYIPIFRTDAALGGSLHVLPNLSVAARAYLAALGISNIDVTKPEARWVWYHTLAIGYSSAYRSSNEDGVARDWPRIPLPVDLSRLKESAELGQSVAALLDLDNPVDGLGKLFQSIAVLSSVTGKPINPAAGDLQVNAGWSILTKQGAVMPSKGRYVERTYSPSEIVQSAEIASSCGLAADVVSDLMGDQTFDIYLNQSLRFANVPHEVWHFTIGGYSVLKKWLSYREYASLGRDLTKEEAREFTEIARRVAGVLLLTPRLNQNYEACASNAFDWGSVASAAPSDVLTPTGTTVQPELFTGISRSPTM